MLIGDTGSVVKTLLSDSPVCPDARQTYLVFELLGFNMWPCSLLAFINITSSSFISDLSWGVLLFLSFLLRQGWCHRSSSTSISVLESQKRQERVEAGGIRRLIHALVVNTMTLRLWYFVFVAPKLLCLRAHHLRSVWLVSQAGLKTVHQYCLGESHLHWKDSHVPRTDWSYQYSWSLPDLRFCWAMNSVTRVCRTSVDLSVDHWQWSTKNGLPECPDSKQFNEALAALTYLCKYHWHNFGLFIYHSTVSQCN